MIFGFALMMVLIVSAAFVDHEYGIGLGSLILAMAGIFIYYNYGHSQVREWVDRWF